MPLIFVFGEKYQGPQGGGGGGFAPGAAEVAPFQTPSW